MPSPSAIEETGESSACPTSGTTGAGVAKGAEAGKFPGATGKVSGMGGRLEGRRGIVAGGGIGGKPVGEGKLPGAG